MANKVLESTYEGSFEDITKLVSRFNELNKCCLGIADNDHPVVSLSSYEKRERKILSKVICKVLEQAEVEISSIGKLIAIAGCNEADVFRKLINKITDQLKETLMNPQVFPLLILAMQVAQITGALNEKVQDKSEYPINSDDMSCILEVVFKYLDDHFFVTLPSKKTKKHSNSNSVTKTSLPDKRKQDKRKQDKRKQDKRKQDKRKQEEEIKEEEIKIKKELRRREDVLNSINWLLDEMVQSHIKGLSKKIKQEWIDELKNAAKPNHREVLNHKVAYALQALRRIRSDESQTTKLVRRFKFGAEGVLHLTRAVKSGLEMPACFGLSAVDSIEELVESVKSFRQAFKGPTIKQDQWYDTVIALKKDLIEVFNTLKCGSLAKDWRTQQQTLLKVKDVFVALQEREDLLESPVLFCVLDMFAGLAIGVQSHLKAYEETRLSTARTPHFKIQGSLSFKSNKDLFYREITDVYLTYLRAISKMDSKFKQRQEVLLEILLVQFYHISFVYGKEGSEIRKKVVKEMKQYLGSEHRYTTKSFLKTNIAIQANALRKITSKNQKALGKLLAKQNQRTLQTDLEQNTENKESSGSLGAGLLRAWEEVAKDEVDADLALQTYRLFRYADRKREHFRFENIFANYYIRPEIKTVSESPCDMLEAIQKHLIAFNPALKQTSKHLVILGDTGSGKTLFSYLLEKDFQAQYKFGSPLLIRLSANVLHQPQKDHIGHYLFKDAGLDKTKTLGNLQMQPLVIIIDGYEERILTQDDQTSRGELIPFNEKLLTNGNPWKIGQIVFMCRKQLFLDQLATTKHFKVRESQRASAVYDIQPFNQDNIRQFTEGLITAIKNEGSEFDDQEAIPKRFTQEWSFYHKELQALLGVNDIVTNPLYLSRLILTLPCLINKKKDCVLLVDVYETLIENLVLREVEKRQTTGKVQNALKTKLLEYSFQFLLDQEIIVTLDDMAWNALSLVVTRFGDNQLEFIHETLGQYLAAEHIWKYLGLKRSQNDFSSQLPYLDTEFKIFEEKYSLPTPYVLSTGSTQYAKKPDLLPYLGLFAKRSRLQGGEDTAPKRLLNIFEYYKKNKPESTLLVWVVSILNHSGFGIAGLDFATIDLKGADLRGAPLHYVKLAQENQGLTEIDVAGAFIGNTCLQESPIVKRARAKSVQYEEQPQGKNGYFTSVTFSQDRSNKYMVTGDCYGIVKLWLRHLGKPIRDFELDPNPYRRTAVKSMAVSPDDKYLVAAGTHGKLSIWKQYPTNNDTPTIVKNLGESVVRSVLFSKYNEQLRLIVGLSNGKVHILSVIEQEVAGGSKRKTVVEPKQLLTHMLLIRSPDILTSSSDDSLSPHSPHSPLWDSNGGESGVLKHVKLIPQVWGGKSTELITIGHAEVHWWNYQTGQHLRKESIPAGAIVSLVPYQLETKPIYALLLAKGATIKLKTYSTEVQDLDVFLDITRDAPVQCQSDVEITHCTVSPCAKWLAVAFKQDTCATKDILVYERKDSGQVISYHFEQHLPGISSIKRLSFTQHSKEMSLYVATLDEVVQWKRGCIRWWHGSENVVLNEPKENRWLLRKRIVQTNRELTLYIYDSSSFGQNKETEEQSLSNAERYKPVLSVNRNNIVLRRQPAKRIPRDRNVAGWKGSGSIREIMKRFEP